MKRNIRNPIKRPSLPFRGKYGEINDKLFFSLRISKMLFNSICKGTKVNFFVVL